MRLSERQLNRATLARQLLLVRAPLDPVAAVRRVTALQGQEPAAPYVALWNRVEGFDPTLLDDAFRDGELLKATLMRATLHIVTVEDHADFRAAMLPRIRAGRVGNRWFREQALDPDEADALVADLYAVVTEPSTSSQVLALLEERVGRPIDEGLWWALRTYGPLVRAPNGERWGFAPQTAYLRAPVPDGELPPRSQAVRTLVRRYLEGFGPADVADVARFTLLTRRTVRAAIADLGDELVEHGGSDGRTLVDVVDAPIPAADVPAPPRLLGMWDSTLLAHEDRGRILPDEFRPLVIRRNGDTLAAVLVDGVVRGVWRQLVDGIEVTPFARLDRATWAGLEDEAARLSAMLRDRDPATFGRYHRWWEQLPATGRRVLAG